MTQEMLFSKYAEQYPLTVPQEAVENELQLLILEPKLAILDETDSGLDVDAVKAVSQGINEYKSRTGGSLLIITHNTKMLESLTVDTTHILSAGKIDCDGGAELVDDVIQNGFDRYNGKE